LKEYLYPEIGAGGFSRVDGTIEFYSRINALLSPDMQVLDYGAGRGAWALDDPIPFRRAVRMLRGKVRKVVACDVDAAVLTNPAADEALVIQHGSSLPFIDACFDIIVADCVFEHIISPAFVAKELKRILKPGGWICARTSNKYGYVAIASALVANRNHARWLRILQPERKEHDIFPAVYEMNTPSRIKSLFSEAEYVHHIYASSGEPAYAGKNRVLWIVFYLWHKLMPGFLQTSYCFFIRKRETQPAE
jgi:SAM-dependent methyltransferase